MNRPRGLSLIGAPTDVGASDRGASMGPEALRVAGLDAALRGCALQVEDLGNLLGPPNPGADKVDGYRHLPQVIAWNRAVYEAIHTELKRHRLPVLLGGDHCLSVGSIAAVARHCREMHKSLRVLWLDAHTDFNTRKLSPSGALHGMPLSILCGFGPSELAGLGGVLPAVKPQWVRQVGIRSVDAGEREFVHAQNIDVLDMRRIDEIGIRKAMEIALDGMDMDCHLHVSFDVDVLDPELAPGVGTTVPGGLSFREAHLCMEMIADTGCMASLDIMELNPALDLRNKTARFTVELVQSMFGKSTLVRESMSPSKSPGFAVDAGFGRSVLYG